MMLPKLIGQWSRRSIGFGHLLTCVSFFASLLVFSFLLAGSAPAAEDVDLHDLTWFVHVDLIDAGAGRDLAFWQAAIDQSVDRANILVEGGQGPFDMPCCARLGSSVSVTTFGTSGDGLDVLNSPADQSAFSGLGPAGSNAFLIDSLTYCGGNFPGSIGCAQTPSCGNGNDDPNLWMVVSVDAFDSQILPTVIAHERGHNACLNHVSAAGCQIMQGSVATPGNGGCLTAGECTNFQAGRTTVSSGLDCDCHASSGVLEPDGTMCTEVASGVCSGGACGAASGDAGVKLIASANPVDVMTPDPDDAVVISALTGEWSDLGQIAPTGEAISGLAFAADSATLYGVSPSTGDDSIITIDPETGDRIAVVGAIANGAAEAISMAYHPGATSSPVDDRLIMMEVSGSTGRVIWVDPASPSVRNVFGLINFDAEEFTGLAYDSIQGRLFASTPFSSPGTGDNAGLFEIDLGSCPPSPCNGSFVEGTRLAVFDGSLSFSPETGKLYQVGTRLGNPRTFYAMIDAPTGIPETTISLDGFFSGGLAAVPEPGFVAGLLAGFVGVAAVGGRKRRS